MTQTEVFRILTYKLVRIQNQINEDYHKDLFLKHHKVAGADILDLARTLIENQPDSSEISIQRTAALLASAPGSAERSLEKSSDALYGLNTRFSGQAATNRHHSRPFRRGRKKGLVKVRRCWVFGENHLARDKHSFYEARSALKRLKKERHLCQRSNLQISSSRTTAAAMKDLKIMRTLRSMTITHT